NFYRQMLAFRRANGALIDGGIEFIRTGEPVLAFRRTGAEGAVVCIFNLSPEQVRITIANAPVGTEPLPISQAAEFTGKRLVLGPNGYAFIRENEAGQLAVSYTRRARSATA